MSLEAMENSTEASANLSKVLLSFSWIDYSLFVLMFGVSALIGVYYGCFGNKQATTKDYLHGGKTMKIFPVAMSLMASNLSGISLLGIPSEMYMYGTQYAMCIFSAAIMIVIVSNVYLPVFYKLQLNSTYEYLKIRFSHRIRMFASVQFLLASFLYIPIVIYVPALAFNQVTGIDLYLITPIVSFICIFYTTLGGLRAVVWTDTLQFSVTLLTLTFVLIMGTISVGGVSEVWNKSELGGRLEFFNLNPDLTERSTFWGVVIGHIIGWMSFVGCNPATIQRFMAVPSLRQARRSLIILGIGIIVTKFILCFSGLIMYAKYHGCDPYTKGGIKRPDQILPYYVLDVASDIPGISGLFIAGVFSTALSTLSTYLNTLSGTFYSDFIAPHMPKGTTEERASNIMKMTVVIMGALCVCLVFVVEKLGSVLEMSISLGAVTAGPLLGLFTLGMVFPMANEKGALWGSCSSLTIISWIVIKTKMHTYSGAIKYLTKPLYTHDCDAGFNITSALNATLITNLTTTTAIPQAACPPEEPFWLFKLSFYYYTLLGSGLTITIGLLVSWMTKSDNDPPVNPDLLSPFVHRFLPESSFETKYTSVEKALHVITVNENEKEREALQTSLRIQQQNDKN